LFFEKEMAILTSLKRRMRAKPILTHGSLKSNKKKNYENYDFATNE